MVHLALNDIAFPGNAAHFYRNLLNVASFDVFPTDDFFDWIFNFKASEPVTARFGALGYETKFFVKNMGTLFIVGVIFVLLLITIPCLKGMNAIVYCSSNERVTDWLQSQLCWNTILRFLIESYILIAISSFINLTELTFSDSGSRASTIGAIVGMVVILLLPFFILYYMFRKFDKLKNKKVISKYGAMYEGLDLDKGR